MYGMPERITSEDIRILDAFFKGTSVDGIEVLKKKIALLKEQDDVSRDAGQKITELQDQIVALYRKEDEQNVEEEN